MSTPPSYGSQPGGGQYPGQAPNPYAGTPAQQQPNPYAAAPTGAPGQQQAYPAPPYAAQPYLNQAPPAAPPYDQPQPGQQPFPGQQQPYPGQQPFPGQQPPQGGGWQAPPPKASKASRFSRKLAIRLGVLVVLGVIAFAWSEFNGDPSTANVGDCVHNQGTDSNPDVHVIKCSDPQAAYKVLKTGSGGDSICNDVAGTVVTYTETGRDNVVLCLGVNKPTG
jgi:hypothetical protein